MAYSSPEEGDGMSEPEPLAEQFGTPPIKHSMSQSRMDKMTGARKLRKLPSHSEFRKDKGRRSRHLTNKERQKERLDARAFKELDTTLQVLGIDGTNELAGKVTASPHAPLLPGVSGSRQKPPLQPTVVRGFASRSSLETSTSLSSEGRLKSRVSGALEIRRSGSPQTFLSRVSSRADSLEDERQKWLQGLDNVLLGNLNQDDLQVALSLASGKANDLKEQLIYWQTPPEAGWQGWEQRIEWLQQAIAQLKDVTVGLQQHGVRIEHSPHIRHYMTILRETMDEMGNMSEMCCEGIVEGLLALKDAPQDLHRAFRAACRMVNCLVPVTITKRMLHASDPDAGWDAYLHRTAGLAARTALALMDATADLQATLLDCSSMSVTLGRDVSAHEVSERCKQLQFAWLQCSAITELSARTWPEQAGAVNCAWCRLMLEAARRADDMQQREFETKQPASDYLHAASSGLSDDSVGSYAGQTGVWGMTSSKDASGDVSDEELQAQAWLPACLTGLLANAESAATAALGCEDGAQGGGECQGLVEELSEALYELALTGNRRVAAMCASPAGLACWALELLEEQACQAVVFVRDLDRSVLGRGENGLVHYETLRKATDTLVNSILRLRRLLKQKRAADVEDVLPRPLPVIRSDSQSSLTAALRQQAGGATSKRQQDADVPSALQQNASVANGRERNGRRHRHRHGTATPPIPEDADAEQPQKALQNGTDDHREERSRQARRHRNRRHRREVQAGQPQSEVQAEGRAEARPVDPFATPEAQQAVSPSPSPPPATSAAPLAVFSSATLGANSLVPAGSRSLFKFGSFSTSPTPGGGPPSPRPPPPRGAGLSPFATGAAVLPAKAVPGQLASIRVVAPELAAQALPAAPRRPAAQARETPDWNGHPMSDPTNGYQLLHNYPSLARVSGEALPRQGSSDSVSESSSRTESMPGTHRTAAEEGESARTTDGRSPFRLPWEGDPFWQIRWEDLAPTLIRKIGSGSFGQVFEAYFHCAPMAVKIINIDGDLAELPRALLRFKQEVDLQRRLSLFPYIVRFQGACCHIPDSPTGGDSVYTTSNVTLAIVMELCRLGPLFKLIEWARKASLLPPAVISGAAPPSTPDQQKLKASPGFRLYCSWQLRLELAKQTAAAVEYMHANNIIHRDLTSYNLLVTDKFEAKVADFNLSRAMKGEMIPSSGIINSPEWAAPERLSGQPEYNGRAADVFSFGVILWELVTLARPWHDANTEGDVGSLEGDVPEGVRGAEGGVPAPDRTQQPRVPLFTVMQNVTRGHRLEFPPCEDVLPPLPQLPELVDLAKACWRQNPVERPTMTEVCRQLDEILLAVRQKAREQRQARNPAAYLNTLQAAAIRQERQ